MRYLYLLLIVLSIGACKSKKIVDTATGSTEKPKTEAEVVTRALGENQFTAEWIDARANIKLESSEMNVGGNAYIRLERDKRLWMSVKKFGFEAARVLITPDSFFVINRLQNEYTAEPLSYIEKKYKMPANFTLLQQVILGNPIYMNRDQLELTTEGEQYHLSGKGSRWASDYYANKSTYYLERMKLREIAENRVLDVFMDDFRDVGLNRPFSHGREIDIESPSTGVARVILDVTRIDFAGPLDMPFSVPSRMQ